MGEPVKKRVKSARSASASVGRHPTRRSYRQFYEDMQVFLNRKDLKIRKAKREENKSFSHVPTVNKIKQKGSVTNPNSFFKS